MERVCRKCGRSYRGLVCQACHPRGSRRKAEAEVEVKAEAETGTGGDGFDALEWPGMAHGAGTVATVGRKRLNVRDTAITGKVIGSLAYGEHVVVWSALANGWYLVQADGSGLTGYVLGACVKLDGELVRSAAGEG